MMSNRNDERKGIRSFFFFSLSVGNHLVVEKNANSRMTCRERENTHTRTHARTHTHH